jgi:hypothetical protein
MKKREPPPTDQHEKRAERLKRGARVRTEDGDGKIVGLNMRRNTNSGPGVRQYAVQLDDGRIRHYNTIIEVL